MRQLMGCGKTWQITCSQHSSFTFYLLNRRSKSQIQALILYANSWSHVSWWLLFLSAMPVILFHFIHLFKSTVGVRQGYPLSPVLFNIFWEKMMQKTLTSQWGSEDDQFSAIRKKMQHKLTPHCCKCPSEDDRFATCGLLMISIFREQWRTATTQWKAGEKQLWITAWKSDMTKAISSSTASSQGHLPWRPWMEKW